MRSLKAELAIAEAAVRDAMRSVGLPPQVIDRHALAHAVLLVQRHHEQSAPAPSLLDRLGDQPEEN